jgi:outer membrane protein TolC
LLKPGIAALLATLAARAAAAETLEQAWEAALALDATLQAAESRLSGADAALAAARAARRPNLTAASTVTAWRDTPAFDFGAAGLPGVLPLFAGDTFIMSEARVSVPLYSGGSIGAGIDAAAAGRAALERSTVALTQQLKLAVAERYVGVLRAESVLAAARANTLSLEAHARDVADMERSGQVPRNDYLAAAVSLADARQRELQASTALEIARAAYNRQTARPLDTPVALVAELPSTGADLASRPVDALVATALERRDELASLAAVAARLEAESIGVRAQTRPQLLLAGGYTFLENRILDREDYWSLALGVQWRAFDGGRSRNAAAALGHQSAAAAEDRADLETLIELEVRSAWLGVAETRERIGVTESAVAQAEENLRVVRDRYRNGEGTNTEVLDAEALRSQSRSNFDNARYDAALAQFRLARAVGAL